MAEYNIDYIEPENERDNPHDVGLEELDAIIYSGKPSAVQAVTWEGLSEDEQNAILLFRKYNRVGYPTDEQTRIVIEGLTEKGVIAVNSDVGHVFTEAGRALLPKAGAEMQPTLAELEAKALEFVKRNQRLEACKVFRDANYSTAYANAAVNRMFDGLPTYTQLQTELAAANERAVAAAAEVARLRNGLEAIAAYTSAATPKPLPPTMNEQWQKMDTDARIVAHENFEHGLALARWELARLAHEVLSK